MRLQTDTMTLCDSDTQTAAVECEGLSKVYRSLFASRAKAVCALQEVSLSVRRGQIVTFADERVSHEAGRLHKRQLPSAAH